MSSKINYLLSKIHYVVQNYFKSNPKLIYYKKNRIDNHNKKNKKNVLIQDIKINSVFVASIFSENYTPAKAKRGLNEIYTKYKEYDTFKKSREDIIYLVWFIDALLTVNINIHV